MQTLFAETSTSTVIVTAIIVGGVLLMAVMAYRLARTAMGGGADRDELADLSHRISQLEQAVRRLDVEVGIHDPPAPSTVGAEPRTGVDRVAMRESILELKERGFNPGDIASQLGQPIGEVELILALERAGRR